MRCALDASVKFDLPWGLSEEEKNKHKVADEKEFRNGLTVSCLGWQRRIPNRHGLNFPFER